MEKQRKNSYRSEKNRVRSSCLSRGWHRREEVFDDSPAFSGTWTFLGGIDGRAASLDERNFENNIWELKLIARTLVWIDETFEIDRSSTPWWVTLMAGKLVGVGETFECNKRASRADITFSSVYWHSSLDWSPCIRIPHSSAWFASFNCQKACHFQSEL